MNFDDAIQKHAEWKMKFRAAISSQSQLDAATIAKDDCCMLGGWLHGEGRSSFGKYEEFQRALEQHRTFHTEAGKVALLINQRQYPQAEKAIGSGSPYATVSGSVGTAIIALKKAIA